MGLEGSINLLIEAINRNTEFLKLLTKINLVNRPTESEYDDWEDEFDEIDD